MNTSYMNDWEAITEKLVELGFVNLYVPYVWGPRERLHIAEGAMVQGTLFNTMSGEIWIGKRTFFGHNCMVLTGKHINNERDAVVPAGRDICIGDHCWIASGAIILGNVTIGDNCTIAAGAIITKDVPDNAIIKGTW